MALVTHPVQGSYTTFPSRPVPRNKVIELKPFAATLPLVVKAGTFLSLRCKSCSSVGAPPVRGRKSLRIAAFKGSANNDESGGRASGSKPAKKSAKLSYVQADSENTFTESPELSYASEVERMSGSLAMQNLFKKWLALLRLPPPPPPNEAVDGTLEVQDPGKVSVVQEVSPKEKGDNILRTLAVYFWGLDATVKVPVLLFLPLYLAVNVAYGAEVSKELTPLWILGPPIIALYIKLFRGICALYVFSFKQTVKLVKNSPTYARVIYIYIAQGKLKKDIHARLWQPVLDIKNKDYREFSMRKMKELRVWAGEKYVDYVESIWPTYCRMIRFLKRANLI